MRRGAFLAAMVLTLAGFGLSQDKPLGDAAREAREAHSRSPHATKTLSSEGSEVKAIKASDDPVDVLARARAALLQDVSHRCREESSGNSGPAPGWADVKVFEIAGSDRKHVVVDQLRPKADHNEWILLGQDGYRQTGNGPWERLDASAIALVAQLWAPDVFQFAFHQGDLKLAGREVIDGVAAFQYQFAFHSSDFDRTINIWVGIDDNLPRRTEMRSVTRSWGSTPVVWQQKTYCTYGNVTIQPPK